MPMSFFQEHKVPLLLSCVAGLLLALHFFHPPAGGLWTRLFFNSLHVPVFGLIAICIYLLTGGEPSWIRRAAVALVATTLLGTLSEAAQIFTSRDASLRDLLADFSGAAGFLTMYVAIRPPSPWSRKYRVPLASMALVILGWIMAPLAVVGAAYTERYAQFPVIARFDGGWGHVLTRAQNIDYQAVDATREEPAHSVLAFHAKPWPGIAFHDVWPNWSQYTSLVVDLAVGENSPLEVNLRVHDNAHKANQEFTDRFSRSYSLSPGRHTLRISLVDLVDAPRDRSMDLTQISELIIFSDATNAGRSLKLYEIRLE